MPLTNEPVLIGIALSPTFIPATNIASELVRKAFPEASDGELLERIWLAGICSIINSYSGRPS